MGRPAKSLVEFVLEGTFRARRESERDLLAGPDLPWAWAVVLQRQYRAARSEPERRAVALAFERAVVEIHAETALAQADGGGAALAAELAALGRPGSAKQLLAFFPAYLVHTMGLRHGEPFMLEGWQKAFLRELSRRDKQGRRVYRLGLLSLPRGSGKTILAAGVALYELVSREDEPDILIAAGSKEQARICFDFCRGMVEQGPLTEWVTVKSGSLICRATGGRIRVISSQGALQHGLNPSLVILDELWNFTTKPQIELYTAATTSLHKRPDAYLLVISTAGPSQYSLLGRIYEQAHTWPEISTARNGCLTIAKDEPNGLLMHWYGAPPGCDPDDRTIWRGANPASWVRIHDLGRHRHDPGLDEASFRRLHLNQWVDEKEAWIPAEVWQNLYSRVRIPAGSPLYVGVDVGLRHDTTAVSWAHRLPGGTILLRCKVWSARQDVAHHVLCEGGTVDLEEVEAFITERLAGRFKVREVAYDPRYFHRSAQHLEKNGLTVVEFVPSSAPIRNAYQSFYQLALEQKIAHIGDTVLAAHLAATAATPTE
ncbi:MAG TPA: terminase TerL endonuclease subunit, partial [Thermoleophilia bacterium]|nr:terminase TerL endonuclease subunit [Thermoleophilia bacterium]